MLGHFIVKLCQGFGIHVRVCLICWSKKSAAALGGRRVQVGPVNIVCMPYPNANFSLLMMQVYKESFTVLLVSTDI